MPVLGRFRDRRLLLLGLLVTACLWGLLPLAALLWPVPAEVCGEVGGVRACQPYGFPPPGWDWRNPLVVAILVEAFWLRAWFMATRTEHHTRLGWSLVASAAAMGTLFYVVFIVPGLWPVVRASHVEIGAWWRIPDIEIDTIDAVIVAATAIVVWSVVEVAAVPDPSREDWEHELAGDAITQAMAVVVADEGGAIVLVTGRAGELLGWEPAALIGRNLVELMPVRYRDRHISGLARYLETGEPRLIGRMVRVAALRRDGGEVPIGLALTETRVNGDRFLVASLWPDGGEVIP